MEVEVVFPKVCGAFYQAYIQDINLQNGSAYLSFPSEWKPSVWVELSFIRLPIAKETAAASPRKTFGAGSKVEALMRHHDNEPPGWWTGTLLKSRGELHVVEFQSGEEKYQDIVDYDNLRSPNSNQPLSKIKMYRKDFPVFEDIDDYCQRDAVHENFRSKIKALFVSYDKKNHSLTVLANDERCLDKASLLIEMHFRDLRTYKALILTKNEAVAQKQSHAVRGSGLKEIRFCVPSDLVAMARERANIKEVRRIRGITSVEFDAYSSMFTVKGESEEALQKARERLEFFREMMLIPRNLAGKVIGKKGNVIQEVLEKSRVHCVKVVGEEEAANRNIDVQAQVPFDLIGRKSEIDNAKTMIEYHLKGLRMLLSESEGREKRKSPEARVVEAEKKLRETVEECDRRVQAAEGRTAVLERELAVSQESLRECEEKLQHLETQWVVERKEIQLTGPELGRGGWATVSVATFRGVRVAAKCIHSEIISPHNLHLFKREMNMAARMRHPNLLQFIGATLEGEMVILTELMPTSLRKELESRREHDLMSPQQVTSIGLDVARALNYLHLMQPHPLIHRDISSANVLLQPLPNASWRAKVSDYGTVNLLQQLQTIGPGNPTYAAPEANNPTQQSPKMDIFSFGVLLLEMLTGKLPDGDERPRLLRTVHCQPLLALILKCLSQERNDRPSASGIIAELDH